MKKRIFSQSITGVILMGTSCIALARPPAVLWDIENITLDISGFISAGASTTNATNIDFFDPLTKAKTSTVPTIVNIPASPVLGPETFGGMKIATEINDLFEFAVQFSAEGERNFVVYTDWLYAQWHITPNWNLTAGRMRLPFYLFSEYANVAYTYIWTRLPLEVYGLHQITDFEGVQLEYRNNLGGGWSTDSSVSVGNSSYLYPFSGTDIPVSLSNGIFTNITLENDILKLNAGYAAAALEIEDDARLNFVKTALLNPCGFFGPLDPALITETAGAAPGTCFIDLQTPFPVPPASTLAIPDIGTAALFTVKNVSTQIITLGYDFAWNHIISTAEWNKTISEDMLLPDSQGWYVLLGFTWDKFTPYVTYSDYRTLQDSQRILYNTVSGTYINPYSYYGPVPVPSPETFQSSINQFLALSNIAQSTIDAGIRYDIWPATAIKFEYRYIIPRENTAGFFDYPPGKRISWITAAVNVVF